MTNNVNFFIGNRENICMLHIQPNWDRTELNLVLTHDGIYVFDLREWSRADIPSENGVTLVWSDIELLKTLLNKYENDLSGLRNVINKKVDELGVLSTVLNDYWDELDALRINLNQYTNMIDYTPVRNPVLQRAYFLAVWHESYVDEEKVEEDQKLFYCETHEDFETFRINEYAETDFCELYYCPEDVLLEGIDFLPDYDVWPYDEKYTEYHAQAFNNFNVEEFLDFIDEHLDNYSSKFEQARTAEEMKNIVRNYNDKLSKLYLR